MFLTKSPAILKWYYPELIWNKSRRSKTLYLTFDDGPIPNVTEFVLKTLKSYDIKASFFCIGDNIVKHPQIFQSLISEGHQIGHHSYNHLNGWKTSDSKYIENIEKGMALYPTDLFRPPFGRIKKSQIKLLKHKFPNLDIYMWDVLSGDFDTSLSAEQCYKNTVKHLENGSIIVFHDSLKAFHRLAYALPRCIEYALSEGYTFEVLPTAATAELKSII